MVDSGDFGIRAMTQLAEVFKEERRGFKDSCSTCVRQRFPKEGCMGYCELERTP